MNVLFITSNRLGDAVLSTGLLNNIVREHKGAKVTVVCGALPASLFKGVPGLEQIIILKKQPWNLHWFKLWKKVAGRRWDIVVDLRDSIVSRTVRAGERHVFSRRINKDLHKVEQNMAVLGLSMPPSPTLWRTEEQKRKAREFIPDGGPVLAIGPTANWIGKTWPAENFITLVEKLTASDGILPDARVAVFAAPGEETEARKVLASIPAERRIDMIAKTDPATAAAALGRCVLFIGNDSGLMHCAAAAGTMTLGLFGPSWPHIYGPWGKHATFVSTPESFDELINYPGYDAKTCGTLMETLSVDAVLEAVGGFYTVPQKSRAGAF